MTIWQNNSFIHGRFVTPLNSPDAVKQQYGPVPNFTRTAGVTPGQAPVVPSVPAPSFPRSTPWKGFLNSFPGILKITS